MLNIKHKLISISLLVSISFLSSYKLVLQTYEHRTLFAELENLRLEKEELSFQSNILIEEVWNDQARESICALNGKAIFCG